ncbi:hypothetical protein SAMN02983003_3868 [Devosia enhydra]|uniref:Uncharacterized protein n=1 Tax=Devosia enhydra TaxID=665118 RepID=A0A1K2I2R5_9HYPH|nr:hypothetical protein [Devosia enhydra]SFZ86674.1 hypothetical protein SAMN02983003_3868 [Devosia enhydra]
MRRNSVDEARRDLLERVQTEGITAAYEAALAICRDPKAPAPARATASATLFRVAGLFDRKDANDRPKEPHEMSSEELAQEIALLERRAKGLPAETDEGIFA